MNEKENQEEIIIGRAGKKLITPKKIKTIANKRAKRAELKLEADLPEIRDEVIKINEISVSELADRPVQLDEEVINAAKQLSVRELLFLKYWFQNGRNGAEAYRTVFKSKNVQTERAGASVLLTRQNVRAYINLVDDRACRALNITRFSQIHKLLLLEETLKENLIGKVYNKQGIEIPYLRDKVAIALLQTIKMENEMMGLNNEIKNNNPEPNLDIV